MITQARNILAFTAWALGASAVVVCAQPTVTAWRSVRGHGPLGDWGIPLNPAMTCGNGSSGPTVETRSGGIRRIEVDFDQAVQLTGNVTVTGVGHTAGVPKPPVNYAASQLSLADADRRLVIEFNAGVLPDQTCYTINVAAAVVAAAAPHPPPAGDTDCLVRSLTGDPNNDGSVDTIDVAFMRNRDGQPVLPDNIRFDVNMDGVINSLDCRVVYLNLLNRAVCTACPPAINKADSESQQKAAGDLIASVRGPAGQTTLTLVPGSFTVDVNLDAAVPIAAVQLRLEASSTGVMRITTGTYNVATWMVAECGAFPVMPGLLNPLSPGELGSTPNAGSFGPGNTRLVTLQMKIEDSAPPGTYLLGTTNIKGTLHPSMTSFTGSSGAPLTLIVKADCNRNGIPDDQESTPSLRFDFDDDCDVDMDDFGRFQSCMTGPASGFVLPGCLDADLDGDQDVDQTDFGFFQRCLSGPGVAPDPNCGQ